MTMPGSLLPETVGDPNKDQDTKDSREIKDANFAIIEIPEKGHGIVATAPITKGTRIFSGTPLLVIDEEPGKDYDKAEAAIAEKISDISLDAQSEIVSMHNAHLDVLPELAGIMQTNGFTLSNGKVALFSKACMMNHSCRPSVAAEWNATTGEMNIHATQDLAIGDELSHDYLHTLDTFSVRQQQLKDTYGFVCECVVCSLPEKERRASDALREEYQVCEQLIQQLIFEHPMPALYAAKTMLSIIEADSIVGAYEGRAYFYAQQIALAHGDIARARVFGERAYKNLCLFKGADHPDTDTVQKAMRYPKGSHVYGESQLWKTTLRDKPQYMSEEEFEVWLWQRAELPKAEEAEQGEQS